MARISGVKYLGIAPLLTNTSGAAPTWGEVKEIPQFISFSGSKNFAELSWYSNDIVEDTFTSITDVDLEIVVGNLSHELKALITGATYNTETGVFTDSSDDSGKEFALIAVFGQMASGGNGTVSQVYYRCKLNVDGTEATTRTDSINDSPITITGKAIPLMNGKFGCSVDSLDENADKTIVDNWTKSVYYAG